MTGTVGIMGAAWAALLLGAGCVSAPTPASSPAGGAEAVGGVVRQGAGAYVYAYEAGRKSLLGPADAMSEPVGEDGAFELLLPPGDYQVLARRRASGSGGGPLRKGDETSAPARVTVPGAPFLTLALGPVSHVPTVATAEGAALRGRVVDGEGKPVAGATAFAYAGTFHRGTPELFAGPTGADGRFTLVLAGDGLFIVGARLGSQGPPRPGDLVGFRGGAPRPLPPTTVESEITIVLRPWEGRKP